MAKPLFICIEKYRSRISIMPVTALPFAHQSGCGLVVNLIRADLRLAPQLKLMTGIGR